MMNLLLKTKEIMLKYRWLLLFFGIAVAICIAVVIKQMTSIPTWVMWNDKEIVGPENMYTIRIKNKKLEVTDSKSNITFSTDKNFKIQDALITDIDRDGENELIVLLWKKGIYGKHRPFWIKSDENTYSQHIFLYDIDNKGTVTHKWGASETGIEVSRMKAMERRNSVLLVEDIKGNATLWTWESWGLKNIRNEVKIAVFGDNIIHRQIYEYARKRQKGNFDFLYKSFLDEIKGADIAALNAETVLVDKENAVSGYPYFGSPIEVGKAIVNAGFNVISCANNHSLDKGIYGIDVTSNFYKENKITYVGIQNSSETQYRPYEIIARNGIKIALFSYTYGTNMGDISTDYPNAVHYLPVNAEQKEKLLVDMEKAKSEVDFIIVFVHWGKEYDSEVTNSQIETAKMFSEGGADLIIGTHPHVIQRTETLTRSDGKETLVYYSLGNFRAYQGQKEETRKGLEAKVTIGYTFDGVKILDYDSCIIDAYFDIH